MDMEYRIAHFIRTRFPFLEGKDILDDTRKSFSAGELHTLIELVLKAFNVEYLEQRVRHLEAVIADQAISERTRVEVKAEED